MELFRRHASLKQRPLTWFWRSSRRVPDLKTFPDQQDWIWMSRIVCSTPINLTVCLWSGLLTPVTLVGVLIGRCAVVLDSSKLQKLWRCKRFSKGVVFVMELSFNDKREFFFVYATPFHKTIEMTGEDKIKGWFFNMRKELFIWMFSLLLVCLILPESCTSAGIFPFFFYFFAFTHLFCCVWTK